MDIAESLHRYLETLAARGLTGALNRGASEADLKNFESEHGIRLPQALMDIYRAFNGQIHDLIPPGEPRWLSLDEIYGKQQEWREFCETYYGKNWMRVRLPRMDAQGLAKNTLYNPFWIPFMADNEGFFCLDYDPEDGGSSEQVIYARINTELEHSDIIHLDDSFALWFDSHARALSTSRRTVSLATLVDEYLTYQKANPALPLNPPASTNDIRITEHLYGIRFPATLKKIWSVFNGYSTVLADTQERWIGHNDIAAVQKAWKQKLQEKLGKDPDNTPRPDAEQSSQTQSSYTNPLWLPIYQSHNILIALDYAPTEEGCEGQPIVIYNTDDYEILSEYDSFDEWLYTFLSYHLYPEDDVEPRSAVTHSYRQEIKTHIEKYLGPISATFRREDSETPIDLLWLQPDHNRPYHALITSGLADHIMDIPEEIPHREAIMRAELMIMLPPEWSISPENLRSEHGYWPIAWLSMLAEFAHTSGNWLGTGHIIPNGDPLTPIADTPFTGVLILPPFVSQPQDFCVFHSKDGTRLNIFCLIPLYPGEMVLKNEEGLDALLEHFDKNGRINEIIDLKRKDSSG
ncbi:MAG: suppressor of fused domain protein [Cardiobacteriaceae bacterium]|nr:suppressor of fused domain protein [Cardiobacteriaceae bacterium]